MLFENFWSPEDPETSSGVLATQVDASSAAYAYGLRPGDIIVGLNRAKVAEISQLRDVLQSVKGRLVFRIYRNGRFWDLRIR